ncbi:MAG: hypothetical protein RhofKO_16840 [Rhodothermales bacterium]
MNKHTRSRVRYAVAMGLLWGLLATGMVAQPSYTVPTVTTGTVVKSILQGGGPDTAGLLKKSTSTESNSQRFYVLLDSEGRPVNKGASYALIIRLSYVRDGSSGFAWFCSAFVWKRVGKGFVLAHAVTNQMSSEEWDRLLGGRRDHDAFNDEETVEAFDAQLDRTPEAAGQNTIRRLNAGLTGRFRVTPGA